MASTELHLHSDGVRALFKSAGIVAEINRITHGICASANSACSNDPMHNPPFMVGGHMGSVSYHGTVFAANPHGLRAEQANGVLSKALKSAKM